MYRTQMTDPDFRREPKTQCYCVLCQRDIKPESPELWVAAELDKFPQIIHPADIAVAHAEIIARRTRYAHPDDLVTFERIGSECARKVGKAWVLDAVAHKAALLA